MYVFQERFFLNPDAESTGQIYPIPITYTTKTNNNFNNLTPVMMLDKETDVLQAVAVNEWVIFNNLQHGKMFLVSHYGTQKYLTVT